MKLHLGAGTIYLENYLNVDAKADYYALSAPKEIFDMNKTTFENYYKYDFCKGSGKCVVDYESCIENLPFGDETADEIVMLHVLEHFQKYKYKLVLKEIYRLLKYNGAFIIAVPDLKETCRLMTNAKTKEEEDWCTRLIYGTQRNQFSHHYFGFTEESLKELLVEFGFDRFENLPNINFYPAIHLKAYKR